MIKAILNSRNTPKPKAIQKPSSKTDSPLNENRGVSVSKLMLDCIPKTMRFIRSEMRYFATHDSELRLSIAQFRILVKLEKGATSHKELAEWLGVTPATLTRMIDTLVTRNLVARSTDVHDRRQILLNVTTLGKSLYDRHRKKAQEKIDRHLSRLSPLEKETLIQGLSVLAELFSDEALESSDQIANPDKVR